MEFDMITISYLILWMPCVYNWASGKLKFMGKDKKQFLNWMLMQIGYIKLKKHMKGVGL